jgi:adenine-specific DNA methylase
MNSSSYRFIEKSFPSTEVSQHSKKEKSIRQGHLSTLSTWWARRPLAASRAMVFLSAIPTPDVLERNDRVMEILQTIYPDTCSCESAILKLTSELSKFENSNNIQLLDSAKKIISETNPQSSLLDCFSGGGSIPLEALRLGIDTYASDLNPIAITSLYLSLNIATDISDSSFSKLLDDIKNIQNEINELYRGEEDCLAYFHARTVCCPNCNNHTPLYQNKWLSKKGTLRAFKVGNVRGKVKFDIYEPKTESDKEESNLGTVKSKSASCIFCKSTFPTSYIQEQGIKGHLGEICYAKCISKDNKKEYIALDIYETRHDIKVSSEAKKWLDDSLKLELDKNGIRHLWAMQYGTDSVDKIFNEQQKNSLIQISNIIYKYRDKINSSSSSKEESLFRYISLIMILNKTTVYNNKHSWWQSNGAFPASIFVRQAISMIWNYVEIPQSSTGAGGWSSASKWVIKALEHIKSIRGKAHVRLSDAANLTQRDKSIDIVAIDPPYFDSITYAYLSDFFYPWMKALLENDFPDWYQNETTPKSEELIVDRKHKLAPAPKDKTFFQKKLTDSLQEINRVLKDDGILTIMYGHKGLDAWTTLFQSIAESGFKVTASWPINTERKVKFQHSRVDALESSCLLTLKKANTNDKSKMSLNEFEKLSLKISKEQKERLSHIDSEVDVLMSIFPIVLSEFYNHQIICNDESLIELDEIEHILSII